MRRNDALLEYEEEVRPVLEGAQEQLKQNLKQNGKKLEEEILSGIDRLCEEVLRWQSAHGKSRIRYLQISLLRGEMWKDHYEFMMQACGQEYFLDRDAPEVICQAGGIFNPLNQVREEMYQRTMRYMGEIEKYDADKLVMRAAFQFNQFLADYFRRVFMDLDQRDGIKAIRRHERLTVKWGGVREDSETVFLSDHREKTQEEFLLWNETNQVEKEEIAPESIYQCWDGTHFEEMEVYKKALYFPGLRRCSVRKCLWERSLILGGNFMGTRMDRTVFTSCSLDRSCFRNAQLDEVHFHQCSLKDVDFRNAQLKGVEFYQSDLSGAIFSRSELEQLHLESVQLQQIRIGDER